MDVVETLEQHFAVKAEEWTVEAASGAARPDMRGGRCSLGTCEPRYYALECVNVGGGFCPAVRPVAASVTSPSGCYGA